MMFTVSRPAFKASFRNSWQSRKCQCASILPRCKSISSNTSPYGQQTPAVNPAFSQPNWEQVGNENKLDPKIGLHQLQNYELFIHLLPDSLFRQLLLQCELKSFCNCLAVGFPQVTMTSQGPYYRRLLDPGVPCIQGVVDSNVSGIQRSQWKPQINKNKRTAASLFWVSFSMFFLHLCVWYVWIKEIHATDTDKDTIFVHYRLVRRTSDTKRNDETQCWNQQSFCHLLQWMMLPSSKTNIAVDNQPFW